MNQSEEKLLILHASFCVIQIFILLHCPLQVGCVDVDKRGETVTELAERLLNSSTYDSRIRPYADGNRAVYVKISIYILDLSSINEYSMDYVVSMYFRRLWTDPRLTYSSNITNKLSIAYMVSNIWQPDIYFINEKKGSEHTITVPNVLLQVLPNGEVILSQKLTLKLSCLLRLELYPMDVQQCNIKFGSYGYPITDMDLFWNKVNPITFRPDLINPEFFIDPNATISNCSENFTVTGQPGAFSCLNAKITMHRKFTYYLIQTYIPSILIVCLSWVSFWIDHHATPARVSLGVLTVLTVTTQSSTTLNEKYVRHHSLPMVIHQLKEKEQRSNVPRVSYVKAIDVWQSGCLFFVFAAFIEYALVNVLQRKPGAYFTSKKWQQPVRLLNVLRSTQNLQNYKEETDQAIDNENNNFDDKPEGPKKDPLQPSIRSIALQALTGDEVSRARHSAVSPPTQSTDSVRLRNRVAPFQPNGNIAGDFTTISEAEKEKSAFSNVCKERTLRILSLGFLCPKKKDPNERPLNDAEFVDRLSRHIFPSAFGLFNIIYWIYYLLVK